jgi:transcription factor IIIB subunit 2
VAKGLNDVVQFQEEIWEKSLCGMEKISLNLDPIDEGDGTGDDGMTLAASHEDGDDDDFGSVTSASASVATTTSAMTKRKNAVSSRETSAELTSRPIKKRKTRHDRSVESASQFLLNPTKLKKATDDNQLLSHFLSSDTSSLSHTFVRSPTRLQLLCAVRPGGSDAIADEELFEEGELEDVFRAEEEVNLLVQLVDWDEVLEEKRLNKALRVSGNRSTESKLEGSQVDLIPPRATGRINMDAFKRMMDPASDLVGCGGVDEEGTVGDSTEGDAVGECYQWFLDLPTVTLKADSRLPITVSQKCPRAAQGLDAHLEGIEEEDWRPMSPDHGGTGLGLYDGTDYYDL